MNTSRVNGSQIAGVCKFWNAIKGFGFVVPDDGGADLFVSQHDLVTGDTRFRALTAGQRVEGIYTLDGTKALAKKVTGPGGAPLPSFKDMYVAKREIESAKPPDPNKNFGTIKWFNGPPKNIGFIIPNAGGGDIFFPFTECLKEIVPSEGDQVEYVLTTDRKGKTMAGQVKNKTQRAPRNNNNQAAMQMGGMQQGLNYSQPMHMQGMKKSGVCKFFNNEKGFGFIIPAHGGKDIHVHKTQIMGGELVEGDTVEYEEQMVSGNKMQATSVVKKTGALGNTAVVNPRFY